MAIIQSFIEMVVMAYAGIFDIKSYMASDGVCDVTVSDVTLLLCAGHAALAAVAITGFTITEIGILCLRRYINSSLHPNVTKN